MSGHRSPDGGNALVRLGPAVRVGSRGPQEQQLPGLSLEGRAAGPTCQHAGAGPVGRTPKGLYLPARRGHGLAGLAVQTAAMQSSALLCPSLGLPCWAAARLQAVCAGSLSLLPMCGVSEGTPAPGQSSGRAGPAKTSSPSSGRLVTPSNSEAPSSFLWAVLGQSQEDGRGMRTSKVTGRCHSHG